MTVNWIMSDQLAKEHMEALHRAAADYRLAKELRGEQRAAWRRAMGVPLVRAGLALAAGVRAARSAPEIVMQAACGGDVQ